MINRILAIYLCALSLILTLPGAVSAQQDEKPRTSVRFKSGLTVTFTSETDPPGDGSLSPGGSVQIKGEGNIVHRVFVDGAKKIYFGYDLEVVPLADSNQFRLTVKQLSVEPVVPTLRRPAASVPGATGGRSTESQQPASHAGLTPLALSNYPEPQILQDGDTLALDVLDNPRTGVKIIDLIKVSSYTDPHTFPSLLEGHSSAGSRGGPARDLAPELIDFKITASKLLVNGQVVFGEEKGTTPGVTGKFVWFYLPGHGRFILSLLPREGYGFQKAGVIATDRLSFDLDGNHFEWISSSPIVTSGGGNWNLWVLHEPRYRPAFTLADTPFLVGATDRIENLLKKN